MHNKAAGDERKKRKKERKKERKNRTTGK